MKEIGRPCIAVIAIALWAGSGSISEAQKPIRIGASMSQSGSLAVPGQNMHRGYQLCVKHANEKGGVLGRRIELHVEDDQSKGSTAAAVYEKLITQDKVDAILGPYSSPITEAMADVSERHRTRPEAPRRRSSRRAGSSSSESTRQPRRTSRG